MDGLSIFEGNDSKNAREGFARAEAWLEGTRVEAPHELTVYGQEKDVATWTMARMNMILHGRVAAEIERDNTLAAPRFTEGQGGLKRLRDIDQDITSEAKIDQWFDSKTKGIAATYRPVSCDTGPGDAGVGGRLNELNRGWLPEEGWRAVVAGRGF